MLSASTLCTHCHPKVPRSPRSTAPTQLPKNARWHRVERLNKRKRSPNVLLLANPEPGANSISLWSIGKFPANRYFSPRVPKQALTRALNMHGCGLGAAREDCSQAQPLGFHYLQRDPQQTFPTSNFEQPSKAAAKSTRHGGLGTALCWCFPFGNVAYPQNAAITQHSGPPAAPYYISTPCSFACF